MAVEDLGQAVHGPGREGHEAFYPRCGGLQVFLQGAVLGHTGIGQPRVVGDVPGAQGIFKEPGRGLRKHLKMNVGDACHQGLHDGRRARGVPVAVVGDKIGDVHASTIGMRLSGSGNSQNAGWILAWDTAV